MILEIAKGRVPVAVRGRTNIVDVRSVAWGTAEALARGKKGRLYVLGGENLTVPGMVARVARLAGVRAPYFSLPVGALLPFAWTSEFIGRALMMKRPLLPVVGLDFSRFGEHYSSEVARKELGYEPPSPADDAILRTLEWFRNNGYL